jgi:hypothetical protein
MAQQVVRKSLIREAKAADFFIKYLWPVYRPRVKELLYARCTRCILNERAAPRNPASGLCRLCEEAEQVNPDKAKAGVPHDYSHEMNEHIQDILKRNLDASFHALVLFSGGKDSCYMALRLREEFPDMRLLFLSVDNCFMSPVAVDNISLAVERLGVSHLWVRPPFEMMKQLFRFALLENNPAERMGLLDFIDGELLSDIARNVAKRFEIPLIFIGLSKEQVRRILDLDHYEWPHREEHRKRTHVRTRSLQELCPEYEKTWWWQGAEENSMVARFMFPLFAWDTPDVEVREKVNKSGVLHGANLTPNLTNHRLILPMIITDYVRHGYFTYEPEFAEMVRMNRASRGNWINTFEVMDYISKTGKLLPASFDTLLHQLDLDRTLLGIP